MRKYWALFSVNFWSLLSTFTVGGNGKNKNKKAASGVAALCFIALMAIYLSTVYSSLFSDILAPLGMIRLLPILIAFVACIMSLMFTAFAAGGIVFGNKDSDLMLALPVSSFTVMLSKIMALYLENLIFCVFMMLPAGALYLIKGGEGGAGFVIRLVVAILFLAILPTLFSLLIGFIFALFQAKLGRNPIWGNILYLVPVIFLMFFVFKLQMQLPSLLSNTSQINSVFSTWLYPIGLFGKAIYGDYLSFLLFITVLTLPFLGIVYLMSTRYKKILTIMQSSKTKQNYKISKMKAEGQTTALLRKEFGRYFGTPSYVFNTGFSVIIVVIAAVWGVLSKDSVQATVLQMGNIPLLPIVMLGISFMCITTSTSCVSISLEGKNLWILKEAPINVKSIFMAKSVVNITLIWIIALVSAPAAWYALNLSIVEGFGVLLLCLAFGPFVAFSGLVINLIFPKTDSPNDTLVMKQSTSVMISIFGGIGVIGIGAVIMFLLRDIFEPIAMCYIFAALLFAISCALWAFLSSKGAKMFQRVS